MKVISQHLFNILENLFYKMIINEYFAHIGSDNLQNKYAILILSPLLASLQCTTDISIASKLQQVFHIKRLMNKLKQATYFSRQKQQEIGFSFSVFCVSEVQRYTMQRFHGSSNRKLPEKVKAQRQGQIGDSQRLKIGRMKTDRQKYLQVPVGLAEDTVKGETAQHIGKH